MALSLSLHYFYPCTFFSPATPTSRGCTHLPLACYRLHCILKSGQGNELQLHCLRYQCSSRQVDCARKNQQLSDLYVLQSLQCNSVLRTKIVLKVRLKAKGYRFLIGFFFAYVLITCKFDLCRFTCIL